MHSLSIIVLSAVIGVSALGTWRLVEHIESMSFQLCRTAEQRSLVEAALSFAAMRACKEQAIRQRLTVSGPFTELIVLPLVIDFDSTLRCQAAYSLSKNGIRIEMSLLGSKGESIMSASCSV